MNLQTPVNLRAFRWKGCLMLSMWAQSSHGHLKSEKTLSGCGREAGGMERSWERTHFAIAGFDVKGRGPPKNGKKKKFRKDTCMLGFSPVRMVTVDVVPYDRVRITRELGIWAWLWALPWLLASWCGQETLSCALWRKLAEHQCAFSVLFCSSEAPTRCFMLRQLPWPHHEFCLDLWASLSCLCWAFYQSNRIKWSQDPCWISILKQSKIGLGCFKLSAL